MAPEVIEMSCSAIVKQYAGCLLAFGFVVSLGIE